MIENRHYKESFQLPLDATYEGERFHIDSNERQPSTNAAQRSADRVHAHKSWINDLNTQQIINVCVWLEKEGRIWLEKSRRDIYGHHVGIIKDMCVQVNERGWAMSSIKYLEKMPNHQHTFYYNSDYTNWKLSRVTAKYALSS